MERDRSAEAAQYAAKKRAALVRANEMRREREEKEKGAAAGLTTTLTSSMRKVTVESYPHAERIVIHNPSRGSFGAMKSATPLSPTPLLAATASASIFRSSSGHGQHDTFVAPPSDAAGREYDLSSRPLLCSSSHYNPILKKREVVFGGADHALYAIQSTSAATHPSPVVKMYAKQFGHSDWVTSVAHLSDGRVVSSAMDGKLCLWELNKRRCADLVHHTKSVSKVVGITDSDALMCISASYDGSVAVWDLSGGAGGGGVRGGGGGGGGGARSVSSPSPVAVLTGHKSPVLELTHSMGLVASGGRDGAVLSWDLQSGDQLQRVRGHEAPVTALQIFSPQETASKGMLLSGAADGTLRLWDPRSKELVSSGVPHPGVPITGLMGLTLSATSTDSGNDFILTAGADGALLFFDRRKGFKTPSAAVHSFEHARNGIYSIALAEGTRGAGAGFSESPASTTPVLFVGDGVGTILCYDLSTMTLRYGLGSSRVGAVRCIAAFRKDRLLAVGNEDGKCLLYDF